MRFVLGDGFELALACDFVIAAENATLRCVEVTTAMLPLMHLRCRDFRRHAEEDGALSEHHNLTEGRRLADHLRVVERRAAAIATVAPDASRESLRGCRQRVTKNAAVDPPRDW